MKILAGLTLLSAGTMAIIVAGCGSDKGMMSRESALVARTIPSSGEVAYDPGAPIHIKFNAAMDTSRFHDRFFFLDASMHDAMHDSLGQGMMSDSTMATCDSMARGMMGEGMGQMMGMMGDGSHMTDTAAFYRGMHERRQRGQLQWNAMLDSCVFMPDSPMMGGRDYVIMMRSMGGQMHGGQLGGMMDNDTEDIMIRFRTR